MDLIKSIIALHQISLLPMNSWLLISPRMAQKRMKISSLLSIFLVLTGMVGSVYGSEKFAQSERETHDLKIERRISQMKSMLDDEMTKLNYHESGTVILVPEEAERVTKKIEGLKRKLTHMDNMSQEEKEMMMDRNRRDPREERGRKRDPLEEKERRRQAREGKEGRRTSKEARYMREARK